MDVDGGHDASDLSASSDSEDSDDDHLNHRQGKDRLQSTHGMDIPMARNIPIISLLAKEEAKQDKTN